MARPVRAASSLAEPKVVTTTRRNLFEAAYERLEEMIVTCVIRPGQSLNIADLQRLIGLGRTPIHQAVTRLSSDTLILVHPRQGLQVAPVDLARERTLLRLRRDVERFVIQLAAERAEASHRNQFRHMIRLLRQGRTGMTIEAFNKLDRQIDTLVIAAAGEPFLEQTLRPLHTIFRRIGWIYHRWTPDGAVLNDTVDGHLHILEAIVEGNTAAAITASDRLIDFADTMFEAMERHVDPSILNGSFDLQAAD